MKLYFVEIQIGSYFLQVIENSPKKAMNAMREEYNRMLKENWKVSLPWNEYVDYVALRPYELELGKVSWN